jgi:hypothetical protein
MKQKNVVKGRQVPPVEEIPIRGSLSAFTKEERLYYGLDGVYRAYFAKGLGGSAKDVTWSKKRHMHVCCGCRYPWRHFAHCPKAPRNATDDLSDLSLSA